VELEHVHSPGIITGIKTKFTKPGGEFFEIKWWKPRKKTGTDPNDW
jgi:hypothetical protein